MVVPELPIQLLRRTNPGLRARPIALVEQDRPDAPVMMMDERAARAGVQLGMRLGPARSLVPALFVAIYPKTELVAHEETITTGLTAFSPRIERAESGAYWLDPSGLSRLYGGPIAWARTVRAYLQGRGYWSRVVIGFDKEAVLVLGRGMRGRSDIAVMEDSTREARAVARTPLSLLSLPPKLRDGLHALGIDDVGSLIALPRTELQHRFGAEIGAWHLRLSGASPVPVQTAAFAPPIEVELEVEPPDDDITRLLFGIKGALHQALSALEPRGEAVAALDVRFILEDQHHHDERVELATATRDAAIVLDLLRLRLSATELPGRVSFVRLTVTTQPNATSQLPLGPTLLPAKGPNLDAANRALARIRAAFGPSSVLKLIARAAHLPEAQVELVPLEKARAPVFSTPERAQIARAPTEEPSSVPSSSDFAPRLRLSAVRRLLDRPRPLEPAIPTAPEEGPRLENGARITRWHGPHRVSGAWWARLVERDYFYAETDRGALLWLYFDRRRRGWFLQGHVD